MACRVQVEQAIQAGQALMASLDLPASQASQAALATLVQQAHQALDDVLALR